MEQLFIKDQLREIGMSKLGSVGCPNDYTIIITSSFSSVQGVIKQFVIMLLIETGIKLRVLPS